MAQRRCHQRSLPEDVTAGLRPEGEVGISQGREGEHVEGPGCLGGVLGCQRCTDACPLAILEGFLGERPAMGRGTGVGWKLAQGTSQGSTEEGGAAPPVVLPVVSWSTPPPVSVADGGEGNPLYSETCDLAV